MKKITALTLALLALVAVLASCSSGDTEPKSTAPADTAAKTDAKEAKEIDVDAVAAKLVADGNFEGELEKIEGVEYVYADLPAGVKAAVYQSTAYSDEVAVFKASDTGAVKNVVEAYVEARIATFKDYAPEQSKKAEDNAAIVTGEGVVVLVISNAAPAEAKALIEKAIG
jgi:hypothetical protein